MNDADSNIYTVNLHYIDTNDESETDESLPLIVIHGLLGSADNWRSHVKAWQKNRRVIAVDLRNHGRSPHVEGMTYRAMSDDVLSLMDQLGIDQAHVLGHSMGGKVAMTMARLAPQRVASLVVADIAPVTYRPRQDSVLDGLKALDTAAIKSRQEADRVLSDYVEEAGVRQFLLKNLMPVPADEKDDSGARYRWRLNLPVIDRCYAHLSAAPEGEEPYRGPVLFVKGADSPYIQTKHRDTIDQLFPNAELEIIEGAGHWLHAEKPEDLIALCRRFLTGH